MIVAFTAITFGLALLKMVLNETSKVTLVLFGLQVYDHSLTPVLKESFWLKLEIESVLTLALR